MTSPAKRTNISYQNTKAHQDTYRKISEQVLDPDSSKQRSENITESSEARLTDVAEDLKPKSNATSKKLLSNQDVGPEKRDVSKLSSRVFEIIFDAETKTGKKQKITMKKRNLKQSFSKPLKVLASNVHIPNDVTIMIDADLEPDYIC